jgi:hypothetical protein
MVAPIVDTDDTVRISATGILHTFAKYMRNKYDTLPVNENQIRDLLTYMPTRLPPGANVELEAQISMEEMEIAFWKGSNAKAPGHDGISHDFLKQMGDDTPRPPSNTE